MTERPPEIRGPYVPKHVLIWAQVIRTACAVLALAMQVTVLCVLLTR